MDPNNPSPINSLLTKIDTLAKGATVGENESVLAYIEKLIDEKKYPDLMPEAREEMKKDLIVRLDDFIASRIIAGLSDEDVVQFEQMLKNNTPEEQIQQFVSTHIEDFSAFLTNIFLEFRALYLGILQSPVAIDVN